MLTPPSYAPNPHVAFAWLNIAGTPVTVDDFTQRPRHLESFSCSFQIESIGTFEFVLFDPKYDFIEELLSKSHGECTFKFGYTTGLQSPWYKGIIFEYVPEFLYDGIRLHIRGLLTYINTARQIRTRVWKDKKVGDIVKEIAKDNGYKADVDDTIKVEYREDLEETDLQHKTWQQHSSDFSFIMSRLRQQAVREKDQAGGYVLYFDPDKDTLHFHPPRYEEGPVKTFVWRNKLTEVIRFSPEYNGNLLATMLTRGAAFAPALDATTVETSEYVKSDTKGGGKGNTTDPNASKTENTVSDEPWKTTSRVTKDFHDKYFAENEAKFWWYRTAWMAAFTGELVIVGDPTVKPFKKYEIQVHKATGGLHWTSGLYWASGIQHSVVNGTYQSTLNVWRSGMKTGETKEKTLK